MKLTIQNVSKSYKDKFAVNNFSIELSEGIYGLLGPNGAGKTTLMNMIVNLIKPTSGQILLDGQNIDSLGDRYRSMLGYLPQHQGVYKNFTAREFLMYVAALKGVSKKNSLQEVEKVLKIVNLQDVSRKK